MISSNMISLPNALNTEWVDRDCQSSFQQRCLASTTGSIQHHDWYVDCFAGDGYVVIGSDDGQIRMYSEKSLTRANTAIPGLGGPITAVDVTYDGKWVLATTKNYLMVVKTTYKVQTRQIAV